MSTTSAAAISAAAIAREQQLKGWSGAKKIAPIEANDPTWRDLRGEVLASYVLG